MTRGAELDVERLLAMLTGQGVDYVVVGGIAGVLWGSARNTFDLDICPATDRGNLEALGKALIQLEARLRGVDNELDFVPDERLLANVELLTLDTNAGPLDALMRPGGAPAIRAAATSRDPPRRRRLLGPRRLDRGPDRDEARRREAEGRARRGGVGGNPPARPEG